MVHSGLSTTSTDFLLMLRSAYWQHKSTSAFSLTIIGIPFNSQSETPSTPRKFIFASNAPNITEIRFATLWQASMFTSATVIVLFEDKMAKLNFLASVVDIRFWMALVSNKQCKFCSCPFSGQTFKVLWEPCLCVSQKWVSHEKFSFACKIRYGCGSE